MVVVEGLRKRYRATEAVRGVSFAVAAGEIFGLLGPNGAGKTTTLECVLGLREADDGRVEVGGVAAGRAKAMVGAVLQEASLQDKISPRQALELFGSFYAERHEPEELLERFGLEEKADAGFATLSGGQRQRLQLALALVNRPRVLVLDEPTAGLDPQARRALREMIRAMREEGRAVLLSTHDLEEAAQLCDRVAVMDGGLFVAVGTPAELTGRARGLSRVIVRTEPAGVLAGMAGAFLVEGRWVLETKEPNEALAEVARRVGAAGGELVEVELRRPTLEDVFLELTGRQWPDAGGAA
jgi:ABC-2 type transport system ATP-binding protein